MIKTFEDWLDEIEGFSLRMERIYDDLILNPKNNVENWKSIREYLKSAYEAGYDNAKLENSSKDS
jgi:hypothetical protein